MSNYKSPYLNVVGSVRQMKGKGAPMETIPGILGETTQSSSNKVLGGLVEHSGTGKIPKHLSREQAYHTDHKIAEKKSATHIPKIHYGQVLYPGRFAYSAGKEL